MTSSELRRSMRKVLKQMTEELSPVVKALQKAAESLEAIRDDLDCDLPEAIDEGRAEVAEDEWNTFQEVCDDFSKAVEDIGDAFDQIKEGL